MGAERPVSAREFRAVLIQQGFTLRPRTSTSHEQWVRTDARGFFKVTVDAHNQPFHRTVLRYMLRQAGLSKSEFFELLDAL